MKKIIKYIIILIVLLIIGFLTFKITMLNKYKSEYVEINNASIFDKSLNIKHESNENIDSFEEMSYGNFFEGYIKPESINYKVKYDDNNEVISCYNISKETQYINVLSMNSYELNPKESTNNVDYSTEENVKVFLNKNEINNDIDLIKYIKDNYYLKNNIFTCSKNMRNNYIINSFIQVAFPTFKSITLIDGDVNGYIIDIDSTISVKEIHLLYKENQYIIVLGGEELTNEEFVNTLLKSISFN